MDATARPTSAAGPTLTWMSLGRKALVTMVVSVFGVAVLLIARRMAGAAQQPLAPPALWLITLVIALSGCLLERASHSASQTHSRRQLSIASKHSWLMEAAISSHEYVSDLFSSPFADY